MHRSAALAKEKGIACVAIRDDFLVQLPGAPPVGENRELLQFSTQRGKGMKVQEYEKQKLMSKCSHDPSYRAQRLAYDGATALPWSGC